MCELTQEGRKLLELLVCHLGNVKPDNLKTYITYKEVHEKLNLPLDDKTYGRSLQHQGLNSLGDWTEFKKLPAITGLIVNESNWMPSDDYFALFGKSKMNVQWWENEIKKSIVFDWSTV